MTTSIFPQQTSRRQKNYFNVLSLLIILLFTGCDSTTLFQSDFFPTPVNQPPPHIQKVGTADIDGPPGSVKVVAAPPTLTGKWVQIGRYKEQPSVSGLKCNVSKFSGDGEYLFSTMLYIPSGCGTISVQFEPTGQPTGDLTSFLHLDFMEDNRIRIDDIEASKFGTFPRNQAFMLQVTLKINATLPTVHIVLAGVGTSGVKDYNIRSEYRSMARQFSAARIWMGWPYTGYFHAMTIVISRSNK
ncbi:MAG TPA: hypothetical protein VK483_08995 [Chitinophagaceae bacterium]|nr:hypothetical protein [Chitinophagaceae bacterium]